MLSAEEEAPPLKERGGRFKPPEDTALGSAHFEKLGGPVACGAPGRAGTPIALTLRRQPCPAARRIRLQEVPGRATSSRPPPSSKASGHASPSASPPSGSSASERTCPSSSRN